MKRNVNYSHDYKVFKRKKICYSVVVLILQILLLVALIGAWEWAARSGAIDTFLTSSPSRIFKTLCKEFMLGSIWRDIGVTLFEATISFLIATLGGTFIAIILWWNTTIRRVLEPYIVVLNSLPKVALGPIIILLMGVNQKAIVLMAVLIMIVLSTINMLNSFMSIEEDKILLLKSMHANKFQILFHLVLPHSIESFIALLKVNVGLTWVGTIMGEYLVSFAGLGYLILTNSQVFNTDMVMTSTFILCVLACLMYLIVALIEKIVKRKYHKI